VAISATADLGGFVGIDTVWPSVPQLSPQCVAACPRSGYPPAELQLPLHLGGKWSPSLVQKSEREIGGEPSLQELERRLLSDLDLRGEK